MPAAFFASARGFDGAILPKVMGAVADRYDMSRGFIVPMVCFALIACYGYGWPRLSRAEALHGGLRADRHPRAATVPFDETQHLRRAAPSSGSSARPTASASPASP